jgi:hypothetical protein
MLVFKKFRNLLFLCLAILLFSAEGHADATASDGNIVGTFPYSNQWIFERTSSFLYISANRTPLISSTFTNTHYQTNFDSKNFDSLSIDYFSRFFGLAKAESPSFLRNFSFWGRYSLGFGARQGQLSDSNVQLSSIERGTMMAISSRFGLLLCLDSIAWIKPYIGIEISPYFFRQSADLSGAEVQGSSFLYGPAFGVHLPLFFENRASIYGEIRSQLAAQNSGQIFSDNINGDLGVGFAF